MTAAAKQSPAFSLNRSQHHGVKVAAYFAQAGAVDSVDTRAAYLQGYIDAAEGDRQADGAGNIH